MGFSRINCSGIYPIECACRNISYRLSISVQCSKNNCIPFSEAILATKDEYMKDEDDSMYTFFKTMAPLIHPVLEPHAEDIATKGVALLHGLVFNETIDFFFAYGMIGKLHFTFPHSPRGCTFISNYCIRRWWFKN